MDIIAHLRGRKREREMIPLGRISSGTTSMGNATARAVCPWLFAATANHTRNKGNLTYVYESISHDPIDLCVSGMLKEGRRKIVARRARFRSMSSLLFRIVDPVIDIQSVGWFEIIINYGEEEEKGREEDFHG